MDTSWKEGDAVLLRGVGHGRLWWAMPARVVEDAPGRVALYWQAGTHWKDVTRHATARELLAGKVPPLQDLTWQGTDVLMLAASGEAHATWVMWEAGKTRLLCWYINLQTPLLRTPIGFDTMDHELDIIISPDRSWWQWKDLEAFREWEKAGVLSAAEARAAVAEGLEAIQDALEGKPPYADGWEHWRPPAGWTPPALPGNWAMEIEDSLRLR